MQHQHNSNTINDSTMTDTNPILSDRAAFVLAVAECEAMATEKQQLYDDPSSTEEQRQTMAIKLTQKWLEASVINLAIGRQDLANRKNSLTDTEERIDLLNAIYKRSILQHFGELTPKQDVIPIKL